MSQRCKYISQIALQSLPQTNNPLPKLQFTSSHHRLWILLLRTSQSFTSFLRYFCFFQDFPLYFEMIYLYCFFFISQLGRYLTCNYGGYEFSILHPHPPMSIPFLHSFFFVLFFSVQFSHSIWTDEHFVFTCIISM